MPKRPLNILHLCSWYPSRKHPTLGNFVARHVEAISREHRGWVLSAVAAEYNDLTVTEHANFREVIVYFRKRLPLLSFLKALRRGYTVIENKGYRPDLIHLHVAWPAGLFCLMLKRPFIISEHFSGYQPSRKHPWRSWEKWLVRKIFNRASLVCPVSQQLGESLQSFGVNARIQAIGNVVDEDHFFPPEQRAETPEIRLLHISTLDDEVKNIQGLLNAFATLLNRENRFTLAIGGDGDLEQLQRQIKAAGIPANQIELLATMNAPEVAAQMRRSDALVLFSWVENQPVVLLEALCCGLPVIATRVGGIPEIFSEPDGQLIEAGDQEALVQACLQVEPLSIKEAQLRGQRFRKIHGRAAIRRQFTEAYLSVLRKANADR